MIVTHEQRTYEVPVSRGGLLERRSSARQDERLRVLLREDRFATSGFTVNVSPHGALVRTSAPLRLDAVYDLYLAGPLGVRHASVKVVRALPNYIYAVRFEDPIKDFSVEASGS